MEKLLKKNKIALVISIIISVYGAIGFILLPLTTRFILPGKLEKIVKRDVNVQSIGFNPFLFTIKIKNFEILTKDKKAKLAGFDKLYINLNFLSSLFKLAPVVDEIELKSFYSHISRLNNERFNFSDLIPKGVDEDKTTKKKDDDKDTKIPEFLIKKISLKNLNIFFDDQPYKKKHEIKELNIDLSTISSFEKDKNLAAKIDISSKVNGANLKIDIKSLLFSKEISTDILFNLSHFNFTFYNSYLSDFLKNTPKSGVLGANLEISLKDKDNIKISGKAGVRDFDLRDKKESSIISFKDFAIDIENIYPLKKDIDINEIALTGFKSEIIRKDGIVNILDIVKSDNKKDEDNNSLKTDEKSKNELLINIDKIALNDMEISFTDYDAPLFRLGHLKEPVKNMASNINLNILSFSTNKNKKGDLVFDALVNDKTKIDLKGKFSVNPVMADISADVKDFSFAYSRGYIPPSIKINIENGDLDLNFKNRLKIENEKIGFKALGSLALKDLKVVERDTSKDFFKLNRFDIKGIDFDLDPKNLKIDEIFISGIDQEIVVDKDKGINLSRIIEKDEGKKENKKEVKEETKSKEKEAKEELFPINLPLIKIENIGVNYLDKSMSPYFSTGILLETGEVKGLSSTAFQGADINIKGKIDKTSPVLIRGTINPLLKDLLLDLKIDLTSLNLSNLTPYSGKFIGRAIEKGQLNLDLDYDIKDRKLKAENKILLDQFILGRDIKSKDALNLPIGFAISLLKDRNGEINLDVPVRGDFNDPKFKVGRLILSTLKNIVVKAATSPFALVASITGGGKDLKYIEFEYGKTDFKSSSLNRLKSIEKLLYDRPGLKLDVTGFSDVEKDLIALKKDLLDLMVGKEKIKNGYTRKYLLKSDEYLKILNSIYLNITGKEFEISQPGEDVNRLENNLLNLIEVDMEELRLLGVKRAKIIKEYIVKSGKIDASRIFIKNAVKINPLKVEGISNARGGLALE